MLDTREPPGNKDYGVLSARRHRTAIGAVIGGAVGGEVGSMVGKGDGRTSAIIIGSVLGSVIGAKIGNDIDDADRACFGHAKEWYGAMTIRECNIN